MCGFQTEWVLIEMSKLCFEIFGPFLRCPKTVLILQKRPCRSQGLFIPVRFGSLLKPPSPAKSLGAEPHPLSMGLEGDWWSYACCLDIALSIQATFDNLFLLRQKCPIPMVSLLTSTDLGRSASLQALEVTFPPPHNPANQVFAGELACMARWVKLCFACF